MQLTDKAGGFTFQYISRYERSELDAGNMTLRKAIALCDASHMSNPRKLLEAAETVKDTSKES